MADLDQVVADVQAQIPNLIMDYDLRDFLSVAQDKAIIVEVGIYRGCITKALANVCSGKIYAIDNWEGDGYLLADMKNNKDEARTAFTNNLSTEITSGKVEFWEMSSTACPAEFVNRNIVPSLIWIDAQHEYANISADINALKPLLQSGGVLCGHDYHHPDVAKAVQDLCGSDVRVSGDNWYYTIP